MLNTIILFITTSSQSCASDNVDHFDIFAAFKHKDLEKMQQYHRKKIDFRSYYNLQQGFLEPLSLFSECFKTKWLMGICTLAQDYTLDEKEKILLFSI